MKEYTNSHISALIDEHIHSDRDRRILKRRLIDGCCFTLSVRYVAADEDPATVPTPVIEMQNANLVVSRIA